MEERRKNHRASETCSSRFFQTTATDGKVQQLLITELARYVHKLICKLANAKPEDSTYLPEVQAKRGLV